MSESVSTHTSTMKVPLYIACPCHDDLKGAINDKCRMPTFWHHAQDSCPNGQDCLERDTYINSDLGLECESCQISTHIKYNRFHCNSTNSYQPTTHAKFTNVLRSIGQIIADANEEEDLDFLVLVKKKLFAEKNSW